MKLVSLAHRASLKSSNWNIPKYVSYLGTSYRLYKEHGFLPDEACRLGLLHAPHDVSRRFVSKSRLVARQRILNHPSFQEMTEDKALFYVYCSRAGLPVPRLFGVFLQGASGVQWPDRPLVGEADWARFFEHDCPGEFVVKPSRGVYGEGILFVDKRAQGFSGADLYRHIAATRRYASYVVQECLGNHPDILALNPARGLQTARVITFVRPDTKVDVMMAYLKPIGGANRVDNHNSGRTGNLLCPIDVRTGTLGDLMTVTETGVRSLETHPDSGTVFKGREFPMWREVQALAENLARGFLPMRAIGWDIAVTPSGPVCVEGNARWDPPKFGDVTALRPVLDGLDRRPA